MEFKKKNYENEYGRLSQNHSFSNTDETYVGTPFAALFILHCSSAYLIRETKCIELLQMGSGHHILPHF